MPGDAQCSAPLRSGLADSSALLRSRRPRSSCPLIEQSSLAFSFSHRLPSSTSPFPITALHRRFPSTTHLTDDRNRYIPPLRFRPEYILFTGVKPSSFPLHILKSARERRPLYPSRVTACLRFHRSTTGLHDGLDLYRYDEGRYLHAVVVHDRDAQMSDPSLFSGKEYRRNGSMRACPLRAFFS